MLVRYFKAKIKLDNPRFQVLLKLCVEGCAGVKNKQTQHYSHYINTMHFSQVTAILFFNVSFENFVLHLRQYFQQFTFQAVMILVQANKWVALVNSCHVGFQSTS